MNKFNSLKLGSLSIGQLKVPINPNVANLRAFPDYIIFQSLSYSINVAVIEQYADDKKSKKTYLLDEEVASQLSTSDYKIKAMHIIYTVDGQVRFAILDVDSTNTWVRSSLELLAVAKERPISVYRDYEAKVYGYIVEESIAPFSVTDEQIDAALCETFDGEDHITSLDHPMVRNSVKKDSGSVVVVDEPKVDVVTDTGKAISTEIQESINTTDTEDDWEAGLEIPDMDMDAGMSFDDIKL
ncbi:hypothetical protein [Shewanella sp. 125m-1]